MRKVTFYIDDIAYFAHKAPGVDLGNEESFKAIYTLYGEGKNIDRYELTDMDGNKLPITSLNGYQKGMILNECQAYFTDGNAPTPDKMPCGVIKVNDNGTIAELVDIENAWENKPSLNDRISEAEKRTTPPSGNSGPYIKQLERLPVYDEDGSR